MKGKAIFTLLSLTIVASAGAFVGSSTHHVQAATGSSASKPITISVVGNADERVRPDMAQVSAGVVSTASTAAKAQQANDAEMNKVMAVLKSSGIAADDIQTSWYNISPQYGQPGKGGRQTIVGFQASDSLNITIHHLSQVGSIVDDLVKAGANQIDNISYSVSNPKAIQQKLYTDALTDARAQAQLIAQKLGLTITGVASVDATQGGSPIRPMYSAATAMQSAAVLSPGTQDISSSVQVVYTAR